MCFINNFLILSKCEVILCQSKYNVYKTTQDFDPLFSLFAYLFIHGFVYTFSSSPPLMIKYSMYMLLRLLMKFYSLTQMLPVVRSVTPIRTIIIVLIGVLIITILTIGVLIIMILIRTMI